MYKFLSTVLLILSLTVPCQAHYTGSPGPNHQWFEQQTNSLGMVCCDEADGKPYEGNYSFLKDGSVQLEDGTKIPKAYVLTGPNPTGKAIVWTWMGQIRCFIPGTLT